MHCPLFILPVSLALAHVLNVPAWLSCRAGGEPREAPAHRGSAL